MHSWTLEMVQLVLEASTNKQHLITQQDKEGKNALMHVVSKRYGASDIVQLYIVQLILKASTDKQHLIITQQDNNGTNAFMQANSTEIKVLLLNAISDKQCIILHAVTQKHNNFLTSFSYSEELTEMALDASTNKQEMIMQQDEHGTNALMYACENGTNEVVEVLLNAATDKQHLLTQQDNEGKSALMYTMRNCCDYNPYDSDHNNKIRNQHEDMLHRIELILNASTDKKFLLAQQDKKGNDALTHAHSYGRNWDRTWVCMTHMRSYNYEKDKALKQLALALHCGKSHIHYACYSIEDHYHGLLSLESVEDKQHLITQQDNYGRSPLMCIWRQKSFEVELLLFWTKFIFRHSSDKDYLCYQQDENGKNLLMYVLDWMSIEYDMWNYTLTLGHTPRKLGLAVHKVIPTILDACKNKQSMIAQQDNEGKNSLMHAAEKMLFLHNKIEDFEKEEEEEEEEEEGEEKEEVKIQQIFQHLLSACSEEERRYLITQQDPSGKNVLMYVLEYKYRVFAIVHYSWSSKHHLEITEALHLINACTDKQCPIAQQDNNGKNLLMCACENRRCGFEVIRLILDASTDRQPVISEVDTDGNNCLIYACRNGDCEVVCAILDASTDKECILSQQNKDGNSPLICACEQKDLISVKLILNASSNKQHLVTQQNKDGKNGLMYACQSKMIENVISILNASTDKQSLVTQQSKDGKNALMVACDSGCAESVQLILDASTDKQSLITQHTHNNEISILMYLLDYWPWTDSIIEPMQSIIEASTEKQHLISEQSKVGRSVLMWACKNRNITAVQLILSASTDKQKLIALQDKNGWHALMFACSEGCYEAVELLLQSATDLIMESINIPLDSSANLKMCTKKNETPFLLAVLSGSLDSVKLLVEKGANITNHDIKKAVELGQQEMVMVFLKAGFNVNSQDEDGLTPLMIADQVQMANFLLENGANIDLQDNQGRSALHHRLQEDKASSYLVIELLLRRGGNANLLDNHHKSAAEILMELYQKMGYSGEKNSPVKMIEEMISAKQLRKYFRTICDDPFFIHKPVNIVKAKDNFGFKLGETTSGHVIKKVIDPTRCSMLSEGDLLWKVDGLDVRSHSSEQIIDLLENEERAFFLFVGSAPALREAIKQEDADKVNEILENSYISINCCPFESSQNYSSKLSPLMLACEMGCTKMARILIDTWKAEVDQVNEEGLSSLSIGCIKNHFEIVEVVLEKRANINLQNADGWTALMFSCREGHLKVAKLLLQRGADPNLQNNKKWTALMIACEQSSSELIQLLLEWGALVNAQKDDKGFALKIASQLGNSTVVKQLLDQNAEVNMQNDKGWTSLMCASKEGHSEVVDLLLESNATTDLQNGKGWSALMSASEEGHVKVAQQLLDHNADFDLLSPSGDSALSLAVINRHTEVVDVQTKYIATKKDSTILSEDLEDRTEKEKEVKELECLSQSDAAIPLTLNALNLIKWKDKQDEKETSHSFHLVTAISDRWEKIGELLGHSSEELEALKCEYQCSEICWCHLMEKWLLSQGNPSYPVTWDGLCSLLVEAGASDVAKHLKAAVLGASSSAATDKTNTEEQMDKTITEKPLYNDLKQQLLFRDKRPMRPPKETRKRNLLIKFCQDIRFILQAVNENEFQAAVILMEPPDSSLFSKAVVFPRPNIVIGIFGGKKTALLHSSEGSDCSDYVQDAIETFPNAQFVIGVGTGYAFDRDKYSLGDVLVSKQICHLKNPIFSASDEIVDCGERVNVVMNLMSTFCMDLMHKDPFSVSSERCSKVEAGRIVSFPAIITNQKTRDKILRSVPEAIGGDMEGGQLLKFMLKRQIEGVALIRGVSHFADGRIGKEWEFTASLAALHYVNYKLYFYQDELNEAQHTSGKDISSTVDTLSEPRTGRECQTQTQPISDSDDDVDEDEDIICTKASSWGVWCGGQGERGVAMLVCAVTGGYHSSATYKWSHDDHVLEGEKYPIIYVTKGGIYKCSCSVLPDMSMKMEMRFLVKKGKDGNFLVLSPPAPPVKKVTRSQIDRSTLQTLFSSFDQMKATLQAMLSQNKAEEIKLLEVITHGSYGMVHQASWKGSIVAAQVISLTPGDLNSEQLDKEIQMLRFVREDGAVISYGPHTYRTLRHTNLSSCLDITKDDSSLILLTPLENGKTLHDMILHESDVFESKDKFYILIQICQALNYLHTYQPPLAHLNVKPASVMVDPLKFNAVLMDYGPSRITTLFSTGSEMILSGSAEFQSPEQLQVESIGLPADVYAFGALAAVLVSEKSLWPGLGCFQIIQKVTTGQCPSTEHLPEDMDHLCSSCFSSSPESRPQISEILIQLQTLQHINEA